MENEKEKFEPGVEELTKSILQLSSYRVAFFRGIFFGLGSAIGASVIAAIVIGILAKVANLFSYLPLINR